MVANPVGIIPLFLEKEGGLSRAGTDTASRNPSPCTHEGKTGWHTNKGITWETFKAGASSLGYSATCKNFLEMPASIWRKIFHKRYWEPWGLDAVKSDVAAWVLVWWAWGSGLGGAAKSMSKYLGKQGVKLVKKPGTKEARVEIAQALDRLAAKKGEARLFNELREHRLAFYRSLSSAPANYKGWVNAYDKFSAFVAARGAAPPAASGGATAVKALGAGILLFGLIKLL